MNHVQLGTPGWLDSVARLPNKSLVKAVDQGGVLPEVKGVASQQGKTIYTCLRHWYDPLQIFGGTYEENKQKARTFFNTFIDGTFIEQYAQHCDFIEEWNEYLANSQNTQEVDERVRWATAAADVWKNEYRTNPRLAHIRLVLCNAAVGNWINRRFAVAANTYDAVIGYHPYTMWKNKIRWGEDHPLDLGIHDTQDWVYLSGLWDTMELDWGIDVDWMFTEAGPFESAITGWRASECLGFDRDLYVKAMRDWLRDVQATPAYAEGRIYGYATYTTGRAGDTWKHFWTEQPELNMLADMTAVEWAPGTIVVPPPPPPPPPEECVGLPRVDYNRVVHVIKADTPAGIAAAKFQELWAENPTTVGPSYDDAGIGDLQNMEINHPFNEPRDYDGDGIKDDLHEGIDLTSVDSFGNPLDVVAAAGGVVERVRLDYVPGKGYGIYVRIDHGDGFKTWYCHMSDVVVSEGQRVARGEKLGTSGSTGNSTGIHLHLTLQRIGQGLSGYEIPDVVDPAPYFG
jgi:hypothetical protein